jgi:bacteriocin-like protein
MKRAPAMTDASFRTLTDAELEQVSGGSIGEGIGDITEGAMDIAHSHFGEGLGDIKEGVRDIRHSV